MVTIAAIVLGSTAVLRYRETARLLSDVRALETRRLATSLVLAIEAIRDGDGASAQSAVDGLLRRVAAEGEVSDAAIVGADGRVFAPAAHAPIVDPDVTAALADALAHERSAVRSDGAAVAWVVPLRARSVAEEARTALYLRASLTPVAAAVRRISLEIGLGAGILAIVGVLGLAMLLARRVLRPLRALAAQAVGLAAEEQADGNVITYLGRAFDALAARIGRDVERLQTSERRYREVVESAADGIFTLNANATVTDVNPSGCALLRRSRAEIVGHPASEFLRPDQAPALTDLVTRVVHGDSEVSELKMRLPGDVDVPIEVHASRLPDGRLQAIARDVSLRNRVLRQQWAVAVLGQEALGALDVPTLMQHAVARVAEGLDAERCQIVELDGEQGAFALRAAVGAPEISAPAIPVVRDSLLGYTVRAEAPIAVEDLAVDPRVTGTGFPDDRGTVSALGVVIHGKDRPFGVLAAQTSRRRRFTADDAHFVDAVANVVALAIARARTDEALRKSESRYRLASRAAHDAMYDWDVAHDRAFWSEGIKSLFGHEPGEVGPGLAWWEDLIHPDDRVDVLRSVSAALSSGTREWSGEYRFRCADGSYAWVHDRSYVDYASDGSPLRAVGAMTDVTEQRRSEEASRRQAGFVRLGREVATTANQASSVTDAILATLRLVCRHTGWPVGHAILVTPGAVTAPPTRLWHVDDAARYAEVRRIVDATAVRHGVGMMGHAWQSGEPAWTAENGAATPRCAALAASGLRGAFALPVFVGRTVVGVLEFFSEQDVPPGDDLFTVMAGVGAQLGRVIERAEAEEHLRDSAERLEALSRRLLAAQETERRHVARELHDEIGQSLTALKLNLQTLSEDASEDQGALLEDSLAIADRTLQQTRDLSLDLRPAVLDDLGLVPALRWYLDRQGRRAGYATELTTGDLGCDIPAEISTTCFRVAQEALTNVARHAHASRVAMQLIRRTDCLELLVRDNGRGFDSEHVLAGAEGGDSLGLVGMRERAALVGGSLYIDSTPGRGTSIRLVLPLVAAERVEEPTPHRRSA